MLLMEASVPEETKRNLSIEGTCSMIFSAHCFSNVVAVPKEDPFATCSQALATTDSGACPKIRAPQLQQKSIYALLSISQIVSPFPFEMIKGGISKLSKERTGELTPPGIKEHEWRYIASLCGL